MEQCILFWLVFAGFVMLTTLIIIGIICLHRLADVKELWERAIDKLSRINNVMNKFDTVVDWFLSREGVKAVYCHANWSWLIVSRDDTSNIYRTLKERDRDKREALAEALYKSTLQAMRDHDKEKKK